MMTRSRSVSGPEVQELFDFEHFPSLTRKEYKRALPFIRNFVRWLPNEIALRVNLIEPTWETPESKDMLLICRALLRLWSYSKAGENERRRVCAAIRRSNCWKFEAMPCDCLCTMRERASVIAAAGGANQLLALKERFNVPYKDGCRFVCDFVNYLNCIISNRPRTRYFSRSVAILQPSYSGKSRLMSRLAEIFPMVYICCPKKDIIPSYPVQTPIDWESLVGISSEIPSDLIDSFILARCISFLNTLALFCTSVALTCSKMPKKKAIEYRKKFISQQYTSAFWQAVMKESLKDAWDIYNWCLKNKTIYGKAYEGICSYQYEQEFCAEILEMFSYKFTDLSMIVCIDNARYLSTIIPYGSKWDLLTHLNHASRYTPAGFALVILGNIPEIKVVSEYPPLKYRDTELEQAVFTKTLAVGLEHFKDCKVASSLTEARSVDFICRFGKPAWNAMHMCKKSWQDILSIAVTKLINCSNFEEYKSQDVLTKPAIIAIMANRVKFNMSPVTIMKLDPVHTHMTLLADINVEKKIATLDYPSDPVLSHAAQYLLTGMDLWTPYLNGFADSIHSRAVLKGERGVLAAQLVICYAIDSILRESIGNALTIEDAPPRWISLEAFLTFFDPKLVSNIPKGLEGAAINLNHFTKASGYVPNRKDMISFISRGAGVLLEDNYSDANLIIPLALKTTLRKSSRVTQKPTTFTYPALTGRKDAAPILTAKHPFIENNNNIRLDRLTTKLQELPTDETLSFTNYSSTSSYTDPDKEQDKSECKRKYKDNDDADAPEYPLDADNVSYILIRACATNYKEDWPDSLRQLNPYTAKIDSVKNTECQRPYIALGLQFTKDEVSPDCKAEVLSMDVSTDSPSTTLEKEGFRDKYVCNPQHIMAFRVVNPHFNCSAIGWSDQQQSIRNAFDRIVHTEPFMGKCLPTMSPLAYAGEIEFNHICPSQIKLIKNENTSD